MVEPTPTQHAKPKARFKHEMSDRMPARKFRSFPIDRVVFDHVLDAQACFLVEGQVMDFEGLRLRE